MFPGTVCMSVPSHITPASMIIQECFFKVLKVSFCDRLLSVVCLSSSIFACLHSRGNTLHPIFMKVYQNIIISPSNLGQVRNWVMWGHKLGH